MLPASNYPINLQVKLCILQYRSSSSLFCFKTACWALWDPQHQRICLRPWYLLSILSCSVASSFLGRVSAADLQMEQQLLERADTPRLDQAESPHLLPRASAPRSHWGPPGRARTVAHACACTLWGPPSRACSESEPPLDGCTSPRAGSTSRQAPTPLVVIPKVRISKNGVTS